MKLFKMSRPLAKPRARAPTAALNPLSTRRKVKNCSSRSSRETRQQQRKNVGHYCGTPKG
jgi:hypothetical protein